MYVHSDKPHSLEHVTSRKALAYAAAGLGLAYQAISLGHTNEAMLHCGHHEARLKTLLARFELTGESGVTEPLLGIAGIPSSEQIETIAASITAPDDGAWVQAFARALFHACPAHCTADELRAQISRLAAPATRSTPAVVRLDALLQLLDGKLAATDGAAAI